MTGVYGHTEHFLHCVLQTSAENTLNMHVVPSTAFLKKENWLSAACSQEESWSTEARLQLFEDAAQQAIRLVLFGCSKIGLNLKCKA